MTIVKTYNVGDTVVVEPYDIFTDPQVPIGWNVNPYGYGKAYDPGETFIYEKPLTLFAQYQDISVTYHIIWNYGNGHYEAYHPGFTTRLGSFIQMADFDIVGFQNWYTKSGEKLSIGQRYRVIGNVDFYMSACNEYELKYDPSGGSGHMNSQYAEEHLYFNSSNGLSIVDTAKIQLNECEFVKNNLSCSGWNINRIQYPTKSTVTIYSNSIAYAIWGEFVKYSLDCNLFLVNQSLRFRYVMLKIYSTIGQDNKVSLSKIRFIDQNGEKLAFPRDSSAYGINIYNIDSDFPLIDSIYDNDTSFNATSFPCYVVFDTKTSQFDVSKYTTWQMCYPTFFNLSYTPNAFSLYFSNDKTSWYFADECTKIQSGNPGSLIYNGQIVVEDLATNINE